MDQCVDWSGPLKHDKLHPPPIVHHLAYQGGVGKETTQKDKGGIPKNFFQTEEAA